jgi:hypothetical protein
LGRELAEQIWPIGFGSEAYDKSSALGEIYRLAMRTSGTLLKQHLDLVFTVDRETIPPRYCDWFSLPWYRIYTLNIDDLDQAVSETCALPRPLKIVSAMNSTPADISRSELGVVHLNGQLSDFPDLTFDPPTYGHRTSRHDAWYQQFIADIVTRPTFFIGTILEEPPFWHYLSQRGDKGGASEMRPRSWLLTKNIPASKRALLEEFNIEMIDAYESEFYENLIKDEMSRYRQVAAELADQVDAAGEGYIVDVQTATRQATKGSADFLLGQDPTWSDVRRGFAAEFDWDREFIEELRQSSDGCWVIHGDPGSGKTTSLMRAAAVLASEGNTVLWITRETAKTSVQMAEEMAKRNPDYVFVDNLQRFSESAAGFMNAIMRKSGAVVVGGIRTGRLNGLSLQTALPQAAYKRMPDLSDRDAVALIGKLDAGNRLGALLSLSALDRVEQITKHAGRQLLVALIEATSGRRFHQKIADECTGLVGTELACYGVVCCAQAADDQYLSRDDVLLAVDAANNAGMSTLQKLIFANTLTDVDGKLRARHFVIAESAIKHFREQGSLRVWVEHLLFLFAVKYDPDHMSRGRYGRLLIRFLNHDFLRGLLGNSSSVKLVYGSIEETLKHEFHFWLQRGSFEIEVGDLDKAETFLLQAKARQQDDILFETAWGYLRIKQALENPVNPGSNKLAEESLALLESVMGRSSSRSPHTYHVYLSQGVKWLQRSQLDVLERRRVRDNLKLYSDRAELLFRTNSRIVDVVGEVRRKLLLIPT